MKKQIWLVGLAGLTLAAALGTWGVESCAAVFPSSQKSQVEVRQSKLMTISIPETTPVADSNGEIPGSGETPAAERQTVVFGSYAQGPKGEAKPLEWIVLDEEDGYTLLMTK